MTCPQVQTSLSLYLYGELEFSQEEALELHLVDCAFCQLALAREKEWHAAINADRQDASFELLSQCRQDLRASLRKERGVKSWSSVWTGFLPKGFSATRWSLQLAAASFLVFAGFAGAKFMDSGRLPSLTADGVNRMGLLDASNAHVRDIQPSGQNSVRIVLDRVQQQEITGRPDDDTVHRLLLIAMQNSADPGVRVDSVEMLQHQTGGDVRDALLSSAQGDPNAAVRIKALEGLRQFPNDPAIRAAVESILKHDTNPDVRSEAIDILVPAERSVGTFMTPDVLTTLQDIINSQQQDEYIRLRSLQVLQAAGVRNRIY